MNRTMYHWLTKTYVGKEFVHHKNLSKRYRVFMIAVNESDQVPIVIYGADGEAPWGRPLKSFVETMDNGRPRFSQVE